MKDRLEPVGALQVIKLSYALIVFFLTTYNLDPLFSDVISDRLHAGSDHAVLRDVL